MSADTLAAETKLSLKTIRRAEQDDGPVPITAANAERIISVLEARGIMLIGPDAQGVGVVLRR